MADPTRAESSGHTVTMPRLSSPFPPGVAFFCAAESRAGQSGGVPAGADEDGPHRGGVVSTRHRLLPEERALLPDTVHPRRLLEFTLGRGSARAALASFDRSLAGAPLLRTGGNTGENTAERTPRWPEGYVGAITHHKGRAAAAVARVRDYAGLGLDLEARRAMSDGMRRRLLRPEERAGLAGLTEADAELRAMIIFSAKESIYKCLNPLTGIYLGFQDAEVFEVGEPAPETSIGALRWRLLKQSGPRFSVGYEGVGAYVLRPGIVLTGVWMPAG